MGDPKKIRKRQGLENSKADGGKFLSKIDRVGSGQYMQRGKKMGAETP